MRMVGPIFWADLRTATRHWRFFLLRFLVAALFFLLLYLAYISFMAAWKQKVLLNSYLGNVWIGTRFPTPKKIKLTETEMLLSSLSEFSENFAFIALLATFLATLVLTPITVLGAITRERNSKMLEFLFATDLTNREIILGKLFSRVFQLLWLLAVPVPIILLLELFGGIPFSIMVYGFLSAASMVLSLASFSMLLGCLTRNWKSGIWKAYLYPLAYLAITPVMLHLAGYPVGSEVMAITGVGNPYYLYQFLRMEMDVYGRITLFPSKVLHFVLFQMTVAILCTTLAIGFLRRAYAKNVGVTQNKSSWFREARERARPKLRTGTNPHYWLELPPRTATTSKWKMSNVDRQKLFALVAIFTPFLLAGLILLHTFLKVTTGNPLDLSKLFPFLVLARPMPLLLLAFLVVLPVAVKSACIINQEREKETWLTSLAIPVTLREMLFQKWRACFHFSGKQLLLFAILIITSLLVGVPFTTTVGLLFVMFGHMVLAVAVGLYFSVTQPSTFRSLLNTFVMLLILYAIPGVTALYIPEGYSALEQLGFISEGLGQVSLAVPVILLLAIPVAFYGTFGPKQYRRQVSFFVIQLLVMIFFVAMFMGVVAVVFGIGDSFKLKTVFGWMSLPVGIWQSTWPTGIEFQNAAGGGFVLGRFVRNPENFFDLFGQIMMAMFFILVSFIVYMMTVWNFVRVCGRVDGKKELRVFGKETERTAVIP